MNYKRLPEIYNQLKKGLDDRLNEMKCLSNFYCHCGLINTKIRECVIYQ